MKVTGGALKGRTLKVPPDEFTRPTQAKLREAIFNSIQFQISESRVLDLFAGSGALGIEALSRGASQVVFVESAKPVLRVLRQNLESLGITDQATVLPLDWRKAAGAMSRLGPYDFVFADPPYQRPGSPIYEKEVLEKSPWNSLLSHGGRVLMEWKPHPKCLRELPNEVNGLRKIREKEYGDTVLSTFEKVEEEGKS